MKVKLSAAALAVAGFAVAASANAAQIQSDFQVKLLVQASCQFNTQSIPDIDLGSHATNAANVTASTEFRVQCTKGATPSIKLSSSDWKLKNDNKEVGGEISYRLTSDNHDWNATSPRTYVSNGSEQLYKVTAKVANVGDTAGTFQDTVTVTVDF